MPAADVFDLVDLPAPPYWILSETEVRSQSLQKSLRREGVWCATQAEGIYRLLALLDPARERIRLSEREALFLLEQLVLQVSDYRALAALLEKRSEDPAAYEDELRRIKRFIDELRLSERKEAVISAVIDQFGETRSDRKNLEELVLLSDAYLNTLHARGIVDGPAGLETLLERASKSTFEKVRGSLPAAIVLDQPLRFASLEESVWRAIGTAIPLVYALAGSVLDDCSEDGKIRATESKGPSRQYPQPFVKRLLQSKARIAALPSLHSAGAEAAALLFDGAELESAPLFAETLDHCSTWRTSDRRAEVLKLLSVISEEHAAGADYGDIFVVARPIEAYRNLLLREFAAAGVPIRFSAASPLKTRHSGSFFAAILSFVRNPTLETAQTLFSHGAAALERRRNGVTGLALFNEAFDLETFDSGTESSPQAAPDCTIPLIGPSIGRLVEFCAATGLPQDRRLDREWFEEALKAVKASRGRGGFLDYPRATAEDLYLDLAFLWAQSSAAERALKDFSPELFGRFIGRLFLGLRRRIGAPRPAASASRSDILLRLKSREALEDARSALRTARALTRSFALLGKKDSALNMRLLEALEREFSLEQRSRGTVDAVQIIPLEEARGLRNKAVIMLGVSADCYPGSVSTASYLAGIDGASRSLRDGGQQSQAFEELWLLRQLLENSSKLILSCPEESEIGQLKPARFLEDLEASASLKPAADGERPNLSNAEAAHPRTSRVLHARKAAELTEYDGAIGEFLPLPEHIAVSALEDLEDCPHRFFFSRIIGLRPKPRPLLGQLPSIQGKIVHQALELFFKERTEPVTAENFASACRELLDAAERIFHASPLDWNADSYLELLRRRIIEGLDDASDDGKRGMLKAALIYQRDLIQTLPAYTEYRFGFTDSAPGLEIQSGTTRFLVRGVVDRIDRCGEDYIVWDYKTSASKSKIAELSRTSLQPAVYAAVVKQNLAEGRLPVSGGFILLGTPNRRDADLASRSKGVLLEQLCLEASGRKPARSAEETVENALERARAVCGLVVKGSFHQLVDTSDCPHCDYQSICERNPVRLKQKIGDTEEERSEELLDDHLPIFSASGDSSRTAARPRKPSAEQAAALATTRSFAVSAGAGSGKTFVLCARIIELLRKGNPFDSILAITFTEKAAQEIKLRIEHELFLAIRYREHCGTALNDEERGLLLKALAQVAGAEIGTIHSFAARAISLAPDLFLSRTYERVLPANEQLLLAERAVEQVLRRRLAKSAQDDADSPSGLISQLLDEGLSVHAIEGKLVELCLRPRQQEGLEKNLLKSSGSGLSKILQALENQRLLFAAELAGELCSFLEPWLNGCRNWLGSGEKLDDLKRRDFDELCARTSSLIAALKDLSGAEAPYRLLKELTQFTQERRASQVNASKSKGTANYWKDLREYLEKQDGLLLEPLSERDERGLRAAELITRLGRAARRNYDELKRERRAVDFEDLIGAVYAGLCTEQIGENEEKRQAVLAKLRARFRHVLVDEFQDTDSQQWGIVRLLAEARPPEKAPRTVFIVGDGQQAIYGFRGGDVRVFNRAAAEISSWGGSLVTLCDNYRSAPEIVNFTNSCFESLFEADFSPHGAPLISTAVHSQAMRAVRAQNASTGGPRTIMLPRKGRFSIEREATAVVDFIAAVLGEQKARPKGPQIAVLARLKSHLLGVSRVLELRGIEHVISHNSGFFELPEITSLENLLRYVADPGDEISLGGVLRSPFVGLSDRELLLLKGEVAGDWRRLTAAGSGEKERSELFYSTANALNRFGEIFRRATPAEALGMIVEDDGFAAAFAESGEEERFKNMLKFVDRLRAAELSGNSEAHCLAAVQWVSRERTTSSFAPDANNSSSPVTLMTIHGAKGLEFPIVILPFLGSSRGGRGADLFCGRIPGNADDEEDLDLLAVKVEDEEYKRTPTVLTRIIHENERRLSAAEEKRVLYVGCTRAVDCLVLCGSEQGLGMFGG